MAVSASEHMGLHHPQRALGCPHGSPVSAGELRDLWKPLTTQDVRMEALGVPLTSLPFSSLETPGSCSRMLWARCFALECGQGTWTMPYFQSSHCGLRGGTMCCFGVGFC